MPLQVVPVITGLTGRPGQDAAFSLTGSGFMEAGEHDHRGRDHARGRGGEPAGAGRHRSRNSTYGDLVAPLGVEGPITVTTAGGSFTLPRPADPAPAFVDLTGVQATAAAGLADRRDDAVGERRAGDHAGRPRRSPRRPSCSSTRPTIAARRACWRGPGTVVANTNGTQLQVTVPLQARTGQVRVVGSAAAFPLQVVPVLRSVGGAAGTAGTRVVLEGTGLVEGGLTVSIDGKAAATPDVIAAFGGGIDQQVADLTVPAGVSAGVVTVTTAGGSFTLRPAATITAWPTSRPPPTSATRWPRPPS